MTTVRIRSSVPDPFNGARGHDYIKARGLSQRIPFKGATASGECQCPTCVRERLLPAVQAICAAASPDRRKPTVLQEVNWNFLSDESVQGLLDVELES